MSRAFLTLCVVASSAFVAWASGCSTMASDDMVAPPHDDDGSPEPPTADCPTDEPQAGASCTQPEGTTCAVGACSDTFVACRRGVWVHSESRPPTPACPAQAPSQGEACPRCFPTTLLCAFGCGDGGQAGVRAVCSGAASGGFAWQVSERECPTFDASVADADPQDGS